VVAGVEGIEVAATAGELDDQLLPPLDLRQILEVDRDAGQLGEVRDVLLDDRVVGVLVELDVDRLALELLLVERRVVGLGRVHLGWGRLCGWRGSGGRCSGRRSGLRSFGRRRRLGWLCRLSRLGSGCWCRGRLAAGREQRRARKPECEPEIPSSGD